MIAIGLGGNLGSDEDIVARFRVSLGILSSSLGGCRGSSVYRSPPWGPVAEQPPFLNAVAVFAGARVAPEEVLRQCQRIEAALGRDRAVRYGPRTIDLDLVLADEPVSLPDLVLPHPRASERNFVLVPLREVLHGDWERFRGPLAEAIEAADDHNLERLEGYTLCSRP